LSNATVPEEENNNVSDSLNDVSCASATACSAVGSYTTGSAAQLSGAEVGEYYNGMTWTATQLSPPIDSGVGDSVACAGTGCVGSGEFDSSFGNIEPQESGTWATAIASPSTTNNGSELEAASCAPATATPSCVLVGTDYPAGSSSATDPLIDSGSGTSYSEDTVPVPSTAHPNGMTVLQGVSCAAAGSCGAIGYYSATDELNGRDDGLIEIDGSSGWTATEAPNPPDVYDPLALSSISCVANWGCAIVGRYQSTADNVVPDIVMTPLGS
jgi:hypothetical protein